MWFVSEDRLYDSDQLVKLMRTRRPRWLLTCCMAWIAALGCDSSSTEPAVKVPDPVGTVLSFVDAIDSVFFGQQVTLAFSDTLDDAASPTEYVWATSDTSVAIVDSLGRALAVGVGSARITVQREGARDTMRLRVVLADVGPAVPLIAGAKGSTGALHCAIGSDKAVYCRSYGAPSQVTPRFQRMPGAVGIEFTSVSTSLHAQCALSVEGAISCWGSNSHFILAGRGVARTDTGPQPVRTQLRFSQMEHGGHAQICGVSRTDSLTYCWGHNDRYQLGRKAGTPPGPRDDSIPAPVHGVGKTRMATTDQFFTCVLSLDRRAYCGGAGGYYAGVESAQVLSELTPVIGDREFASISSGDDTQCAIALDESAWCWGQNSSGQLGIGNNEWPPSAGPREVLGNLRYKKVVAYYEGFACGITTDDDLYCWGAFPPLSVSSRMGARRYSPVAIAKGIKFRDITGRLCGITMDGRALCW